MNRRSFLTLLPLPFIAKLIPEPASIAPLYYIPGTFKTFVDFPKRVGYIDNIAVPEGY